MKSSVFDYKDYKVYLNELINKRAQSEKGQKTKLAQAIGCQSAYLSQVLNGEAHLSPEQAVSTNQFLGHTQVEAKFFLSLVLRARAGSKALQALYDQDINEQLKDRLILKNRVRSNRSLSERDQARYYSSWHYAAVHVIVSLSPYRTKQSITKALNLSPQIVNEALEFLVEIGILKTHGSEYRQGETSLYLDSRSPFIHRHHANWRLKALQSLERPQSQDLHYSGVITCSHADLDQVREILIQAVQKIRTVVKDSEDETMAAYNLDIISLLESVSVRE